VFSQDRRLEIGENDVALLQEAFNLRESLISDVTDVMSDQ
jgi:hypothetical protein